MAFFLRQRLFALFIFFWLSPVFAQEFTGEAALSPFHLPDKGEEISFEALHLWGNLQFTQEFSPNLGFDIRVEHDPILLNRLVTRLAYRTHYLAVHLGPFLGVLNGDKFGMFPGLSLSLETVFPGIFFASLRLDSTIGRRQWETGDYTQDFIQARAGFWVPNVIVCLEYSARFFGEKTVPGNYRNEWTRFNFSADVFKKNVPYRVLINAGYEHISRTPTNSSGSAYLLRAVYSGLKLNLQLHPSFDLNLGAEIPIYSWSPDFPVKNSTKEITINSLNLSTFTLGFRWMLPEKTVP
jgi:hypothetical protein